MGLGVEKVLGSTAKVPWRELQSFLWPVVLLQEFHYRVKHLLHTLSTYYIFFLNFATF